MKPKSTLSSIYLLVAWTAVSCLYSNHLTAQTYNEPSYLQHDHLSTAVGQPINDLLTQIYDNDNPNVAAQYYYHLSNITTPFHGTIDLTNNQYLPNPNFRGSDLFLYTVCSNADSSRCTTASVKIDIGNPNDNSLTTQQQTLQILPNTSLPINLFDNVVDPQNDPFSVVQIASPQHGTITNTGNGTILYEPNSNFVGQDLIAYRICDQGTFPQACNDLVLQINIALPPIQLPPVWSALFPPSTTYTFNLFQQNPTDSALVNISLPTPISGNLTYIGNGNFSYLPNADNQVIANIQVCSHLIPSYCQSTTIYLYPNTNSTADNPIIGVPDRVAISSTAINVIYPFTNVIYPLANDITWNNSDCFINSISTANQLLALMWSDTSLLLLPNAGALGTDTLFYQTCLTADTSQCVSVPIIIDILPPPLNAQDDTASSTNHQAITIKVLDNDQIPVDADLVLDYTKAPSFGTIAIVYEPNNTFSILYTPNPDFYGIDIFSYGICTNNSNPQCDIATVTVRTLAPPPVFSSLSHDDLYYTFSNTNDTINVTNNDIPLGNNQTFIADFSPTFHGSLSLLPNTQQFVYVRDSSETDQIDYFLYTRCSNTDPSRCTTSKVQIERIDTLSSLRPMPDNGFTLQDTPVVIEAQMNDLVLLPNNGVQITNLTNPQHGTATIMPNGTIVYTPEPGFSGVDNCVYEVCYETMPNYCATASINIVVMDTDPPLTAAYDVAMNPFDIEQLEVRVYISGGTPPYTITGDYNGVVNEWGTPQTNTFSFQHPLAEPFSLTITDNAGDTFVLQGVAITIHQLTIPITLLQFDATAQNNDNVLTWTTASEANNQYFSLWHSTEGNHFEPLARLSAAGNSTTIQHYNYVHHLAPHPNSSRHYYQLWQTDYDGKQTLLATKTLLNNIDNQTTPTARLFPQPANDKIFLDLRGNKTAEPINLQLYNVLGTMVWQQTIGEKDQHFLTIPIAQLQSGWYRWLITQGASSYSLPMLKQ